MDYFGKQIFVVSPEDLIISKLIWIQELQSSVQIEDIKSLVEIETLDWTYIKEWVNILKLATFGLLNTKRTTITFKDSDTNSSDFLNH